MAFAMQSLDQITETFSLFDDWEDRYRYLIDLGKTLPEFPETARIEANLVRGCTSRVWMVPEIRDGAFRFVADSDAHIVRGLIAVLMAMYEGVAVAELKSVEVEKIFGELGLEQNLSPNRRNGFFSMVERIRALS